MTRATELTDDGLLRRMIAGDEEAFTLLYRRRQPSIYRFALHMSGNRAVAEDVTQEVFMTLIRQASRFDPARGTLGGFLFGVARNHLRKRAEQDRRLVPLVEDADFLGPLASVPRAGGNSTNGNGVPSSGNGHRTGHATIPTSLDEFASFEMVGRVRQAIATLPENYREVVIFCELEEMSYEEVATVLACPVGTVRSRLHRARAMLLEKLRHAYPERRASAVGP
jgi:RNA polymerase sigma-70 factor (ECF subfamily)